MAHDHAQTKTLRATSIDVTPQENTPLLAHNHDDHASSRKSNDHVVLRVLFTAFILSVSFGVTQVPLVHLFGEMTCNEYYETHPDPGGLGDRCRYPDIEAATARAIALLGASTTVFGVGNLFLTGWWIKRFGIKSSLLASIFWPIIRLLVQNVGVEAGSGLGIAIIQLSQVIILAGSPTGYLLSLNSYVAELVKPVDRTGTLGQLAGCTMFGSALGFLLGGWLTDQFDIGMPFKVDTVLFALCMLYAWMTLPVVQPETHSENEKRPTTAASFFEPLRMFIPQRWVHPSGKVTREYGVLLLGIGTFLGVTATGYIPTLLQLFSIDVLDFGATENGWLISLNCTVRGFFLTLGFPRIITAGRRWCDRRQRKQLARQQAAATDVPTNPEELVPEPTGVGEEPVPTPMPAADEEVSYAFDLLFTRYSILADGILTGLAMFVTRGWELYLVAVILPLAAGTGSAAKGTILQMCSPSERTDALSAISLVDMIAKLSTIGVFGGIFALFAAIGRPELTFTCNAAVALLGFCALAFARIPAAGSTRLIDDDE